MKEQFVERVSNKCDGDEDWFSLKRELLDIASDVWLYKGVDVAVCRKSYLECGNRVRMRKVGRNIVRQKKDAEGVLYMTMDQKAKQRVGEKKGVVFRPIFF